MVIREMKIGDGTIAYGGETAPDRTSLFRRSWLVLSLGSGVMALAVVACLTLLFT